MRKISLIATSLVLIGFVSGALAQEVELPGPGLSPDSPFYFLEIISEGIGTFFTFGDLKKAERYAVLASERVTEAQAVVEKGKPEFAEKALKRYEDQLNRSLSRAEKAKAKGISIKRITEIVAEATGKHLAVLEEVLEKVPEKAKTAVAKAREVSMTGQKNALRALAEENPEKATEINLKAAEARLKRAEVKTEEGETEEAEEAVIEFENQHKFGEEISQIAQGLGIDTTTVEQLVGKATSIHLEILAEIYEKVPEQAKSAIEKAMEVSVKGHERAVQALEEKDVITVIPDPEEVLILKKVPEEVLTRIREKVKKELEEELGLRCGGWDTFGKVVCECDGQLEKSVCPPDVASCDGGTDICYGECGECICYRGPAEDGREIPCEGRDELFKRPLQLEEEEIEVEEELEIEKLEIEKPETPRP